MATDIARFGGLYALLFAQLLTATAFAAVYLPISYQHGLGEQRHFHAVFSRVLIVSRLRAYWLDWVTHAWWYVQREHLAGLTLGCWYGRSPAACESACTCSSAAAEACMPGWHGRAAANNQAQGPGCVSRVQNAQVSATYIATWACSIPRSRCDIRGGPARSKFQHPICAKAASQ
jgi:hypothetical protein